MTPGNVATVVTPKWIVKNILTLSDEQFKMINDMHARHKKRKIMYHICQKYGIDCGPHPSGWGF